MVTLSSYPITEIMKKASLFTHGLVAIIVLMAYASCKPEQEKAPAEPMVQYDEPISKLPIERLRLPDGFKIEVYADSIDGARSMAMGDDGTLFVGTRNENKVYAIQDRDKDYHADRVIVLDTTLEVPNGIAFKDASLYVAEVGRLVRYDSIESKLYDPPKPIVVYDDYPTEFHHGWKYIAFGPDGKLYVPVGAPCNITVHVSAYK